MSNKKVSLGFITPRSNEYDILQYSVVAISFLLTAHEPSDDDRNYDDDDNDHPWVAAEIVFDCIYDVGVVHHVAAVVPVRKKRGANILYMVLVLVLGASCLLGIRSLTVWTVLVVHFVDPVSYTHLTLPTILLV